MRIYDCQRVDPSSPIKYLLPNLKRERERERERAVCKQRECTLPENCKKCLMSAKTVSVNQSSNTPPPPFCIPSPPLLFPNPQHTLEDTYKKENEKRP
jgi:hypothetical protein